MATDHASPTGFPVETAGVITRRLVALLRFTALMIRSAVTARGNGHRSSMTLLLLAFASASHSQVTYDGTTTQLTLPTLMIGKAVYSSVVVDIGMIVSGPSGTHANGTIDSYDPASNQLTVQTVVVGSVTYHNVVATVRNLISIGSVSGADSYQGGQLTIGAVQVGATVYTGVRVAVPAMSVVSVAGGMPAATIDQYDAPTSTLIIPAVQVGTAVYTNVTVNTAGSAIESIGGKTSPANCGLKSGGSGCPATVFSVSTNALSIVAAPTAGVPYASIGMTLTGVPSGGFYYKYTSQGDAVTGVNVGWQAFTPNTTDTGEAVLQFDNPGLQGSGGYASTVTLEVCLDAQCQTPVAGSPQVVVVTYTVTGNAVSDGSWNTQPQSLNLESPSTGPALTTSVTVTSYELPPYGAFLNLTAADPAIIQNNSFLGTSYANAYADGVYTLTLASPAQLGPGIYNDPLTVSACFDRACTKQPMGSPWAIPFTYTVTASAGREFQQRILPLSAQAMAADPAGKNLYIATWDYNGTPNPRLFQVDAATGATLAQVPLPGYPRRVVVSPDGAYVYVVLLDQTTNTALIVRVVVATGVIDVQIPFPQLDSFVADLEVSPTSSRTIAVSYTYVNPTVSAFRSDAIYDDGVARPNILQTGTTSDGYDVIQWSADGNTLYIASGNLYASPVTAAGLGPEAQVLSLSYGDGFSGFFHQLGGLLYSDGGAVVDPATATPLGRYALQTPTTTSTAPAALSQVLADPSSGRAFAVYEDSNLNGVLYTLQSYSLTQYTPIWIARFPSQIYSPVRWGTNGLAFIMNSPSAAPYSVVLINGSFVAP
jgi:hypothetical protein